MTTIAIADPFASPHQIILEQLEPFCDGDLQRFGERDLLAAYDVATAWAHELPTAETAVMNIAAEWRGRYGRNLPRFGSDLPSSEFAELAAQFDAAFDTAFAQLDATN